MPAVISTLVPPDSNLPFLGAPRHHHGPGPTTYIVALAALAVFAVVRVAVSASASTLPWLKLGRRPGRDLRKDYGRNALAAFAPATGPGPPGSGHKQPLPIWPPAPAMEKSRGVSNSGADDPGRDESPAARGEAAVFPGISPGIDGEEEEQSTMDGAGWSGSHRGASAAAGTLASGATIAARSSFSEPNASRHGEGRPPHPPPPLTPPTLSAAVFDFEERRHSYAVSIPPELGARSSLSLMRHPNPDYLDGSSADVSASLPATPRRASFAKAAPVAVSAAGAGGPELFSAKDAFAPSSFPSSPILPPPPPSHNHDALYAMAYAEEEIDAHGEVVLVADDPGEDWTRHTRVYGGGACLACMAAGGGGFYGDRVPPEHKR